MAGLMRHDQRTHSLINLVPSNNRHGQQNTGLTDLQVQAAQSAIGDMSTVAYDNA